MNNLGKTMTVLGTVAAIGGGALLYNTVDPINGITATTTSESKNAVIIETVDMLLM